MDAGLMVPDLAGTAVSGSFSFRAFSTLYASGIQPSVYLSRRLGIDVRVLCRAGESIYKMEIDGSKVTYLWYGGGCEIEVSRHLFLIGDVELYRGDGVSTDRYALEAGWRF